MAQRRFAQVDVFSGAPMRGNPVAVVIDAEGLEEEQLQAFARWTNLSETTFLLPPTNPSAHYRVRIFTPDGELPFAGHPTLGSAHAWGESISGPTPTEIVQECAIGLVRVKSAGGKFAFAAPELLRSGPVEPDILQEIFEDLNLSPGEVLRTTWADNGPGWVGIELRDRDLLLTIKPSRLRRPVGLFAMMPAGASPVDPDAPRYEVRALYPSGGVAMEDPVTGSLNAALAQWLIGTDRLRPPFTAQQGTCLQRQGLIHIEQDAESVIWVGGKTTTLIGGTVEI